MTELLSDQIRAYYDATTTPVEVDTSQHPLPAPTVHLVITDHHSTEDIMLAPDREERPTRARFVLAISAAIAAIALVAGLIIVATRADDAAPADVAALAEEPAARAGPDRSGRPQPAEPGVETSNGTTVELTPDEQAAVDVAERYFAAFAGGDAETVLALSDPSSLSPSAAAEAGVVAWWSIASRPGADADGWPTGACRITTSGASAPGMRVDCPVAVRDPVAITLDVDQLAWGVYVTDDGLVDRLSEALDGFKNYAPVWSAYADYLRAARPDDYAATCDPAAYDSGSINYTNGIAITEACAELLADVSEDVAAWIDAGRPELPSGS